MRLLTVLLALLTLAFAPVPPPRPGPQRAVNDVYALLKESGKVALLKQPGQVTLSGDYELKVERLEGRTLVNPILRPKDNRRKDMWTWTYGAQEGEIEATRRWDTVKLTLRFGYAELANGYVSFYVDTS